ncbi:MAG TPA: glycosyltransferase [Blastocatellia bacterium]|nr:glycosyltransferase [Blastocatellia bacterium]
MIVDFFEPPAEKRVGGLEAAIRSMESFLVEAGVAVRHNPSFDLLGKDGVPEVVDFHGLWEPGFLKVSAFCRRSNIPYIASTHGMLEPWALRHKRWKKWPWFLLFEQRHLAGATRLLTTSGLESDHLRDLFPDSQRVVLPLGLTADKGPDYQAARRDLGWEQWETVLLFLSRLHPKKGLHLLLDALKRLDTRAKENVRLVIVGGGDRDYVLGLRTLASRQGLRRLRIDWVGEIWSDDKWKYLQGADLFCLPSFSENFGLAILEALQVGTRVLTTTQTPWTDALKSNAGFLCEPTETGVQAALEEFFSSRSWSAQQRDGLAGQMRHRYAWESVGPAYIRLYEDVCGVAVAR